MEINEKDAVRTTINQIEISSLVFRPQVSCAQESIRITPNIYAEVAVIDRRNPSRPALSSREMPTAVGEDTTSNVTN